jgi:N-acetylneuraminate synthase/sialic acid synthase
MKIRDYIIDDRSDAFLIAEIGHNHQGNLDLAKQLIKEAAACGANAVKLQKRDVRNVYTKKMYDKPYDHENSFGATYGQHREALEFGKNKYTELKKYAESLGLVFFATVFDFQSLEFLKNLDMPLYKIASGDIRNTPLLEAVAKTNKPIIYSTGGSTIEDVRRAYEAIKKYNDQICIMQCTSAYPAMYDELDLNVIPTFKKEFPDAVMGFSGHDNGILAPVIAYILGAKIIEKHFTLYHAMKGTDHKFSLEPIGLKKVVRDLKRVNQSLGGYEKRIFDSEKDATVKMGKSIVTRTAITKGNPIRMEDVTFKSPGTGIPPYRCGEIIGRKALDDLPEEHILTMEDVE